ncbi:hypothetical protein GCM10027414_13320 [Humibacter ginsengiterrae]
MNAMAVRYGAWSPRTADLPKAFTFGEFSRGALTAFLVFQPMGMVIALVSGAIVPWGLPPGSTSNIWAAAVSSAAIGLIFGAVYGLPFSVAALLVGAPLAYLLGLSLRRVRADAVHLMAFALFGLVLGALTTTAADMTMGAIGGSGLQLPDLGEVQAHYAAFECASGVAVTLGRLVALRKARKGDAVLLGLRHMAEGLE